MSPSYVDWASAKSLKRLGTDCIDLYQIHVGDLSDDVADRAGEALESLVEKGRIRAWGWSTDNAAAARRMLKFPHFAAVQQELSVLCDGPEMLALCAEAELASLNRSPLAMGMLSGKFSATSRLAKDDVRAAGHSWVRFFADGRPKPETLAKVDALRDLLTSGGRTVAQGALGWNLARSPHTIPFPASRPRRRFATISGPWKKAPCPPPSWPRFRAF